MTDVFLQTTPFFLLIACGYGAARVGLFRGEAVVSLTKFVFYFALSAMLFNFASRLDVAEVFNIDLAAAYFIPTLVLYLVVAFAALRRGTGLAEAAIEAQCGVIGNVGFLGLPMLALLLGDRAAGPMLVMLSIDMIFFGSLVVMLIVGSRQGGANLALVGALVMGLLKNPMIVSISAGLAWSAWNLPMPGPGREFLVMLGAAATPCALFAIGASLADKSAERVSVALWLSFVKLVAHPLAVGLVAWYGFGLPWQVVGVMIAASAMPTAGNVYIVAQHYRVAPMRASSTILVSTLIGVATLTAVIDFVN
ncbi:AEC family transporter [Halovulum dunhuangense]|uniref:AEC family transporter n=1 Tax=Halovulum dunhuangense TaxID=1505036 RepID=A0A849L4V6_9RHOB|nr:AEC family transporter [Halovulum dunhuangense]NNU81293.1 AEC family transporter [Halovulum dunhuangense]